MWQPCQSNDLFVLFYHVDAAFCLQSEKRARRMSSSTSSSDDPKDPKIPSPTKVKKLKMKKNLYLQEMRKESAKTQRLRREVLELRQRLGKLQTMAMMQVCNYFLIHSGDENQECQNKNFPLENLREKSVKNLEKQCLRKNPLKSHQRKEEYPISRSLSLHINVLSWRGWLESRCHP